MSQTYRNPSAREAHLCIGYAPEKIPYGITRYKNETRRLYRTMDTALKASKSGYLVGDKCTIADIACWGWVTSSCTAQSLAASNQRS